MALNKKLVKEKLNRWESLSEKIASLSARRNKELDPFIKKYNEETKAITEKYQDKLTPLETEAENLSKEISQLLLANTDKNGEVKAVTIEDGKAVAQLSKTEGARVVKVKDFFAAVKDRSDSFLNASTWLSVKLKSSSGKMRSIKSAPKKPQTRSRSN
ncbi:hypothetical protein Bpfe_031022 [Biomphalaria pfeifferi]|uniref:Uncharacterized protein n=1 Tax=Biomphalaria pfeifferi TaxID=112525 RepID=A0AAD8ANG4_BIOPF|nr:hypothetical protein Bpfe_031022 [Biomphalaria pfeifferi]